MDRQTALDIIENGGYERGTSYTINPEQQAKDTLDAAIHEVRSEGGWQGTNGNWYFD